MNTFKVRLLLLVFSATLVVSCAKENDGHNHEAHSAESYTCPMHPSVVKTERGKCPICGMDLVPVNKPAPAEEKAIMLSDNQIKLANISVRRVSQQPIGATTVVNGTVAFNLDKSEVISSRVPGRIERLAIRETGVRVAAGSPLYTIYSEELLTLQQEYLLALEQYEKLGKTDRYKSLLEAAKRKLKLYGLTDAQITKLRERNDINANVTIVAPASGIVTQLPVTEGEYVNEGTVLMRIDRLANLWIEAELYPNETGLFKRGSKITVHPPQPLQAPLEATVTFLSPEIKSGTRVTLMRAEVENPDQALIPGQRVSLTLQRGGHQAITVPIDAVIRTSKGSHVYVKKAMNTFYPREVETGIENGLNVEIKHGLSEGDTIAVSGAYLLYSEIVLKKGGDPIGNPDERSHHH